MCLSETYHLLDNDERIQNIIRRLKFDPCRDISHPLRYIGVPSLLADESQEDAFAFARALLDSIYEGAEDRIISAYI